ncbi:MAG: LPS export ABC transporter periplasmic protein LptC [Bacteroidia bacterium]
MLKRSFHTIFFFLLVSGFAACENDIAEVNSITASNAKNLPLESSTNVEIIYSDSAIVRAKLNSPQIDRYAGKKPYLELPKGMNILFYKEDRSEQSRLTANYGIAYDNGSGVTEKMEAKGNVIVVNEKGEKLNTEHLTWNALTKMIYTDDFVKITTRDQVIWGNGMEAKQDFSEYRILDVQGEIDVKDEALAPNADTKQEDKKK